MATILIVEDESRMLRLLELSFAEEGFATRRAADAETGLKIFGQEPIDLVVTDLKPYTTSGNDFLEAGAAYSGWVERSKAGFSRMIP